VTVVKALPQLGTDVSSASLTVAQTLLHEGTDNSLSLKVVRLCHNTELSQSTLTMVQTFAKSVNCDSAVLMRFCRLLPIHGTDTSAMTFVQTLAIIWNNVEL